MTAKDPAGQLAADADAARELLRQLHEAMRDAGQARRALKTAEREAHEHIESHGQNAIDHVAAQARIAVEALGEALQTYTGGMPLRIACPYCHTILAVRADIEGKCPGCGASFAISLPAEAIVDGAAVPHDMGQT